MTVTAKRIGIHGRLAADPRFLPATADKEAITYARILNDEYTRDGSDADSRPTFTKEVVGYDLEMKGKLAEAFELTYKKGDLIIAVADKEEWAKTVDGIERDVVSYRVRTVGAALVPNKVLASQERLSAVEPASAAVGPVPVPVAQEWPTLGADDSAYVSGIVEEAQLAWEAHQSRSNPFPEVSTPNFGGQNVQSPSISYSQPFSPS